MKRVDGGEAGIGWMGWGEGRSYLFAEEYMEFDYISMFSSISYYCP